MQNRVLKLFALVAVIFSLISCSQSLRISPNKINFNTNSSLARIDSLYDSNICDLPTKPLSGERILSASDFSKIEGTWIEQTSTQLVKTNSGTVELDPKTNYQSLILQSAPTGNGYSMMYAMYGLGGIFDIGVSKPIGVTINLHSVSTTLPNSGYWIGIADYNSISNPGKKYSPWHWIPNITESAYSLKFANLFSDIDKKIPINPVSPNGSIYIVVLATSNVEVRIQRLVWTFSQLDGRYIDASRQGPFAITSIEKSPNGLAKSRVYYPYPNSNDPYYDPFNGIYRPAGQSPVVVILPQRDAYFSDFDQYYKDLIHRLVSWGFIVIFPRYEDSSISPKNFTDIFKYVDTCFAYMQSENSNPNSPFFGKVLTSRRLVLGVGFGGGAALAYAATTLDKNVLGAVAIAPKDSDISGDVKITDLLIGPKLNKPIFIISGELDNIAKHADVQTIFNTAGSETGSTKTWFEIKGANHKQFYSTTIPILGDNENTTISKIDQIRIMNRYVVASLQTILGTNYQIPLLPDKSPKIFGGLAEIWTIGDAGAKDNAITRTIKP